MYRPLSAPKTSGVLVLLATCLVAFLLQTAGSLGDTVVGLFAFWAPVGETAPYFRPWQLLTYAFLHGGLMHLVFNALALYFFGPVMERQWGRTRFLIFSLVCALGGALAHLAIAVATGEPGVMLGLSGVVMGVLAAFALYHPNEEIYFYFFLPVKAKYLVPAFALLDLYGGVSGRGGNVANFAHLGGLAAGFLLAFAWKRRGR